MSKIQITQGTGTNIDGQLPGNGNFRQTITVGDGLATLGVAPVDATLGLYVGANQVGPWNVSATVYGTISATGVTTVFQGGAPWLVTGSVGATQLGAPWTVNASIQGVPGVIATIANSTLAVTESGAWNVTATIGNIPAVSQSGAWNVTATITQSGLVNALATVTQGTNPWLVNASIVGQPAVTATISGPLNSYSVPQTTGGLSVFQGNLSATVATLKSTAGQVYGYHIFNVNATQAYVNFYNASTATVGLTNPFLQLGIPAGGGATFDSDIGMPFSAPIMISACVSIGGTGTPGVPISANVYYF